MSRKILSLILATLFLWSSIFSNFRSVAFASPVANSPIQPTLTSVFTEYEPSSEDNWYEIDTYLTEAIRNAYKITEEFATSEFDGWVSDLMESVDDEFLDWYFNYFNQKAMEFGVPFAWLAFKVDFLDVLKNQDEKNLNAEQVIQKRMLEDFNHQFRELVMNEKAEQKLSKIIERIGRTYSSAIGFQFAAIQFQYQVPEKDWQRHLQSISEMVFDTGNSKGALDSASFNSNLSTKVLAATTAIISSKLAFKFAAKAGAKLATKFGASAAIKMGANLIDPALAIAFLAWDFWDYHHMVAESCPALRKNIEDYLNEMKFSILESDPENSIMAAIAEVQTQLLHSFLSNRAV
ncbi:hypothetical protein [Lyngbya sp. PCC 8106]|uniref:hypothetical protein n=1 Tax=Lyngbya sp. (strain PCC 8106) TaxID=313612 RepID=UPI0012E9B084|nr:hypothetical protein [Lyngbya sp. PCC 8106]